VLLLDTHVLIWSVSGDERRLGRRTRSLLTRAESRGELRVSALTLFEVTALHTLGRLRLRQDAERWLRDTLDLTGVRVVELSFDAAVDAGLIPRTELEDPIDRLLVATARQVNATFVTSDARILNYATTQSDLRAHDASR
jgi:PIN domain nuclease of toxin-antitoxin system